MATDALTASPPAAGSLATAADYQEQAEILAKLLLFEWPRTAYREGGSGSGPELTFLAPGGSEVPMCVIGPTREEWPDADRLALRRAYGRKPAVVFIADPANGAVGFGRSLVGRIDAAGRWADGPVPAGGAALRRMAEGLLADP